MSNELDVFSENNFNHAVKVAQTLAKSSIVPMHFRGKGEDIFACLVLGAELGFKPMQALNSIVMIQGNCTLKAQTQMAMCIGKVSGLKIEFKEDIKASTVSCHVTRGENSFTSTWDDVKAGAMGLLSKDNYRKQKMTMYRWRSCSEALKIICPDVLMGIDSFEDMVDIEPQRETMSQTLRREVEMESPTPPEEKVVGPLYRFSNGKFIGKQLKDLSKDEIEEYYNYLVEKKNTLPWQKELCFVLSSYLTDYEIYKTQENESDEN